ncbi:hypothetical protein Tco_0811846 [Tanacetum coccineum]
MVPAIAPLIGFSEEIIWPIGQTSISVTIGGILTLRSSKIIPLECMMVSGPKAQPSTNTRVAEERIKVAIHPEYPEQTVAIGSSLTEDGRKELCGLLRRNLDIFALKPVNMTGVLRHIPEHQLNVREGCPPVKQNKRSQSPERNKAIQEEVKGLVASVTSYGPSHLGLSFPPSSAWLALLLRYTRSPGLKLVLSFKASSFCTMSNSVVLRVGMPIFAGITASIPYVNENEVSPLLDLIMVLCAHKTCGISSIRSLLPLSNHAFIPSPKLLFALSTKPLACGYLTEAKRWRIFSFSHQSLNGLSLNFFPLSDIISPGRPNLQTMLSHTNFLIWLPVMVATGFALIHFMKYSIATIKNLTLPPAMSIPHL